MDFIMLKNAFKERNFGEIIRKLKKRINVKLSDEINILLLDEVDITPTLKCNLNCVMCHQHGIKHKANMGLEDFKRLIPNLKKTGVAKISLVGGEIFVMPEIWAFIGVLEGNKIKYDLATNATLLAQKDILKLKSLKYLERVSSSLDGDEEVHNKIRRNPYAYQKALKNIKKLMEEGIMVNVGCVIQKANFEHIEKIVKNFCDEGIKDLSFLYELKTNEKEKEETKKLIKKITGRNAEIYTSSFINPLGELSENQNREMSKKVENIKKIAEDYGVKVSFPLQMQDSFVLNKENDLKEYSCSIFRGYNFAIYNDCNIHFCPFIALEGNFDASRINPKEIVNCEEYKRIRKFFKEHGAFPVCRLCCALRKK